MNTGQTGPLRPTKNPSHPHLHSQTRSYHGSPLYFSLPNPKHLGIRRLLSLRHLTPAALPSSFFFFLFLVFFQLYNNNQSNQPQSWRFFNPTVRGLISDYVQQRRQYLTHLPTLLPPTPSSQCRGPHHAARYFVLICVLSALLCPNWGFRPPWRWCWSGPSFPTPRSSPPKACHSVSRSWTPPLQRARPPGTSESESDRESEGESEGESVSA